MVLEYQLQEEKEEHDATTETIMERMERQLQECIAVAEEKEEALLKHHSDEV